MNSFTINGYAVLISRKDESKFFAAGSGSTPAIFYKRGTAIKFKTELAEAGISGVSVVKVKSTTSITK